MGKYAPLRSFLSQTLGDAIPMTFAEIEAVIGEALPASKKYPAWWSNNPSNNVMTREWLAAGFQTESVDIGGEKLVFRRMRAAEVAAPRREAGRIPAGTGRRHPAFGCLKGHLKVAPGTDLTLPADPDWGRP